jgi:uncharacterized protein
MTDDTTQDGAYPVTERNRVRRMHERGRYDHETVHPILDAALLAHIGYVIDGQPYCTPTAFWREEETLFWHGSSASRALRAQAAGIEVCVTVTHVDGLVLARSGFHHSINYRSVMAFGRASLITEPAEKRRAMDAFLERFFPGRAASLRPPTDQEVKATSILRMDIAEASAKLRAGPPKDDEEDYGLPVWAGVIPLYAMVGTPQDDERLAQGAVRGGDIAEYRHGRPADEAFLAVHRLSYGGL